MFVPVRKIGDRGVITDTPAYDLPLNAFTYALNMRFRDQKAEKSGGWARDAFELPAGQFGRWFSTWLPSTVLTTAIATSTDSSGTQSSQLHTWNGSLFSTTNTVAWSADWHMETFAEFMIANNTVETPWVYPPNLTTFQPYAGFPAGWTCDTIRSYKNFLIVLGLEVSVSGDFQIGSYPNTVVWSDAAELNELPDNFNTSDPASLSSFNELPEDTKLVDCLPLGNANILYLQDAVYAMTLTGGSFIFSFRRLFSRGILNRNCAVAFDNFHFVVGQNTIYTHDGSRINRIATKSIETSFYKDVSDITSVKVAHDPDSKEIYIYYLSGEIPSDGYSEVPRNNRAMIWNYEHDTWTFEDLPAACVETAFLTESFQPWNTFVGVWNQFSGLRWSQLATSQTERTVSFLSTDYTIPSEPNGAYKLYDNSNYRDGQFFNSYLERISIDMDEVAESVNDWKQLARLFPQVSGAGEVYVQVGGANVPEGRVDWKFPPEKIVIGQDRKAETRIDTRYLSMRFGNWDVNTTAVEGQWSVSGWDLEIEKSYRR